MNGVAKLSLFQYSLSLPLRKEFFSENCGKRIVRTAAEVPLTSLLQFSKPKIKKQTSQCPELQVSLLFLNRKITYSLVVTNS